MHQSKLRLSFVRVETWHQAVDLLYVRNDCRDGMTHVTSLLTENDQYKFYMDHLSSATGDGKYEAYLLQTHDQPIGYGLLKWDDEKEAYWMTAGLIKKFRGRGLSRFLISFITEMGHREGADVYIDVWEDNLALIGDIKVGYEVVDQLLPDGPQGRILNVMKHNRNRTIRFGEQYILERFAKEKLVAKDKSSLKEIEEVDAISRGVYSSHNIGQY